MTPSVTGVDGRDARRRTVGGAHPQERTQESRAGAHVEH